MLQFGGQTAHKGTKGSGFRVQFLAHVHFDMLYCSIFLSV